MEMSIGKPISTMKKRSKDTRNTAILFLILPIVGLFLFQIYPMLVAVRNSFYNVNLLAVDKQFFVGLENYKRIFQDAAFANSLIVTLKYTLAKVVLQVPMAFLLALLVHKPRKGVGFVRTSIFAPTVTATSIVAIIWSLMLHPTNGLINSFLNSLNLPAQKFLTSGAQALPSIITMTIWQDVGFTMLIFLGGLQSINKELLEVAELDGANAWQRVTRVIIPLMKRSILYASLTTTIFSFKVFTVIHLTTQGGPFESTKASVYYIYQKGIKFLEMGYASAMAVVLVIIITVVALIQNKVMQAED